MLRRRLGIAAPPRWSPPPLTHELVQWLKLTAEIAIVLSGLLMLISHV
jgi:hypothetical protein